MPTDLHYLITAKFGADYSGDNQVNSMTTTKHTYISLETTVR